MSVASVSYAADAIVCKRVSTMLLMHYRCCCIDDARFYTYQQGSATSFYVGFTACYIWVPDGYGFLHQRAWCGIYPNGVLSCHRVICQMAFSEINVR